MASGRFWETIRVSNGLQFDEETSRKVEALYLTPDVVTQRGRVLRALELREGERVLDIGSGPGLLASYLAFQLYNVGLKRSTVSATLGVVAQRSSKMLLAPIRSAANMLPIA